MVRTGSKAGSLDESSAGSRTSTTPLLPGSSAATAWVVDCLALNDNDPSDALTTLFGDAISAHYQMLEDDGFFVDPPEEWKAARRSAGLEYQVLWKLKRQLRGRRRVGAKWAVGYKLGLWVLL